MSTFNPQNPSQTTPFPYTSPTKGDIYNQWDPSVFPRSYNLKLITYDTGSNITRIDYYSGATSFTSTGSLVFSHEYQYVGSNATGIITLLP